MRPANENKSFPHTRKAWDKLDWLVMTLIIAAIIGLPAGPFLWWWTGSPLWIVWTVCSVILFAAG